MRNFPRASVPAFLLIIFISQPLWAAHFLWRAEGVGSAYILGSIHVARPELYPLPEPVMEAFRRSRQLVVEVDAGAIDAPKLQAYIRAHGLAGGGSSLEKSLSPETREILAQSGLKTARVEALKPWLAALTLQTEAVRAAGYDEKYGLDKFFLKEARGRGLDIIELETLPEQMAPLAEMSLQEADLFFRVTLFELAGLQAMMEGMFESWRKGDAEAFAAIFFREYDKYPELLPVLDKVIFRRNEKMAARIEKLLRRPDGPYFIVIGAGHLVGPGSVLDLLAKSGCRIQQE